MSIKKRTKTKKSVEWSSEKSFILVTATAAIGLGNIWRFPYLVGANGGASFILVYLIAVIAIGLPIMIVEISAGKNERGGVIRTFTKLRKKLGKYYGWFVVLLTGIILSYYLVVTGWTLGFAVESLSGNVTSFSEFTNGYKPLFYFFLSLLITTLVALKGIRLIEKISLIFMPLLALVVLVLAVHGMMLPGAGKAFDFLFKPDFSNFFSPKLWALAFGQAFYSLSIGQGQLTTYGSFLPKKINIPRSTSIVAGIETSVALIAGLMIFPIVFTFGLDPSEGTRLVFDSLPLGFKSITFGPILAIVFFWLLFFAAISSCIASMEVIKTAFAEELKLSNKKAAIAGAFTILPLGIISAFSFTPLELSLFGRPFLEFMDLITANQVVVISGLLGAAIIGWSVKKHKLLGLYSLKYRHLARHTVITVRFLWIAVLSVMIFSLAS